MKWWWDPLCTRSTRLAGFFYSASSLKQQNADRHVAPLGHIIMIPSQPVFALSPTYQEEKQQLPILQSLVWLYRNSNPQSATLDEGTLTITQPMLSSKVEAKVQITCIESTFRHTNSISKFRSSLSPVVTSRLLNRPLHTLFVTMMSSTISIICCWEKSDSGLGSSV